MSEQQVSATLGLRLAIAAAAAGAAAIHFAMIPSHADEWLALGIGFAVVAWLQAITGAATAVRPSRQVLLAVVVVNLGALGVWALSRTAGLPWGPDAGSPEDVTAVDLMAAALQAAAVLGAGAALAVGRRRAGGLAPGWVRPVGALAATVVSFGSIFGTSVVLASPSAVHDHGDESAHEHVDGEDHAHVDGDTAHEEDGHDHEEAGHDPVLGLDVSGATPGEIDNARALVADMEAAMARYTTTADVEAAGYRSIGDSVTGYEHFISLDYIANDTVMKADEVESIVFEVQPDGTKKLVTGMFILPFGETLETVPDTGTGDLTVWHDHQNLCWEGATVVAVTDANGDCPRGTFRATPPMLHVWVVDNPCGRFAGIDGSHGSGCSHSHDDSADGEGGSEAKVASTADAAADPAFTDADLGDIANASASEVAAARSLVTEMEAALARYTTTADVEAAGYRSIGDAVTGHEHFVNVGYTANPTTMKAAEVESIVFEVQPDGTKRVVSGMFILPPGQTMEDVPDLGTGDLTPWHDHQNLCWEGLRVVGILDANGECPRGEFRPTAPMLHVWVEDQVCGRFAGIEGRHGDGCAASHDHETS